MGMNIKLNKIIVVLVVVSFLICFSVISGAVFVLVDTDEFGGKADIILSAGNHAVVFSNEYPSNETVNVSISTAIWCVTINDPDGDTFNFSITTSPDVGTNSSNGKSNGTKNVTLTGLSYNTLYTVYVDAIDLGSGNWTNESFIFTTEESGVFVLLNTVSFGGKADVQTDYPGLSNEYPTNNSVSSQLQPYLSIDVVDYQGNFNVTWLHNKSSVWTVFAVNISVGTGTYKQLASWANETDTKYFWAVHVNDTEQNWINETYDFATAGYVWGNWSEWWTYGKTSIYDCGEPFDMQVNYQDIGAIGLVYLEMGDPGWIPEDVNDDGKVNYVDIGGVALFYGESYP